MRLVQTAGTLGVSAIMKSTTIASSTIGLLTPGRRESGSEIHALSIPAGTFTGDLYFIEQRDDGVWFAVGDVAGKGLDSAIFMKMVHEELDYRFRRDDVSVTCLVSCVHDLLSDELPSNKFVSLVAGHLGIDGTLELVNAGHAQPILIRADGTTEVVDSTGPVAGILPGARWCARDLRLESGEAILLYSDGATEARSPNGDELDVRGLEEIVRLIPRGSSREIIEGVRAGIEAHRNGHPADDDLTIVAILRR